MERSFERVERMQYPMNRDFFIVATDRHLYSKSYYMYNTVVAKNSQIVFKEPYVKQQKKHWKFFRKQVCYTFWIVNTYTVLTHKIFFSIMTQIQCQSLLSFPKNIPHLSWQRVSVKHIKSYCRQMLGFNPPEWFPHQEFICSKLTLKEMFRFQLGALFTFLRGIRKTILNTTVCCCNQVYANGEKVDTKTRVGNLFFSPCFPHFMSETKEQIALHLLFSFIVIRDSLFRKNSRSDSQFTKRV